MDQCPHASLALSHASTFAEILRHASFRTVLSHQTAMVFLTSPVTRFLHVLLLDNIGAESGFAISRLLGGFSYLDGPLESSRDMLRLLVKLWIVFVLVISLAAYTCYNLESSSLFLSNSFSCQNTISVTFITSIGR